MFSPMVAIRPVIVSATVCRQRSCRPQSVDIAVARPAPRRPPLRERLERLVAGDEIGLGVELDHGGGHAGASSPGDGDHALGGDAVGLLGGLGEALGAQPVDGRFHVASGFLQRLLAVHHADAGLVAQFLHQAAVISAMVKLRSDCVSPAPCREPDESVRGAAVSTAARGLRLSRRPRFGRPAGLRGGLAAAKAASSSGSGWPPVRPRRRLGRGAHAQRRLNRRIRGADIDAHGHLALGQAVEHGVGDQVAIELQRAGGVVIARDRIGDADRIAVGVENGDHRDIELARFLDGDGFLVGVDHEHQVGNAAHVLDAAQ